MKQAVIIYWSKTGNTEKVAFAIKEGLIDAGVKVTIKKLRMLRILISSIMTSSA